MVDEGGVTAQEELGSILDPFADRVEQTSDFDAATPDQKGMWVLPQLDLLGEPAAENSLDQQSLEDGCRKLEMVLERLGSPGKVQRVRGKAKVVRYELEPAPGAAIWRLTETATEIARDMQAPWARVLPLPDRTSVRIDVAREQRQPLLLRELIDSDAFEEQNAGSLPLVLGIEEDGSSVVGDLSTMPHLLIAGTTGSGKSVALNAMLVALLFRLTPDQCRLVLIDPAMVELNVYDGIPHLLAPVVTDAAKAVRALEWAAEHMEDRYRMMATAQTRSLASFNEKVAAAKAAGEPLEHRMQIGYDPRSGHPVYDEALREFVPLPRIVIVIDELTELMAQDLSEHLTRLAKRGRAAGIHLLLTTNSPIQTLLSPELRANLPARVAFKLMSERESQVMLSEAGAEDLLGKGDLLYAEPGRPVARLRGALVSGSEAAAVAEHWRSQSAPSYVAAISELDELALIERALPNSDGPESQTYRMAVQLVVENRKASSSWLSRQLRVGYEGAARLIERMERQGIVSTPDHVGRRDVLIRPADLLTYL